MHPISRRFAIAGVAALLTLGVTAVAMGLGNFDPTTTWNVTPILKTFPADRACPADSTLIQDQFQSVTSGVGEGTATATYTIDGKSEVTLWNWS